MALKRNLWFGYAKIPHHPCYLAYSGASNQPYLCESIFSLNIPGNIPKVNRQATKSCEFLVFASASRTVFNYSRQTSRSLVRFSLLPDLESPSRSLPASSCFSPATHEAKHLFSMSQNLVIVTNSKIPDLFAEVSPTHYKLACGMLLLAYVSEFLWLYLIYVVSFCSFLLLYPAMCLEDFVLFASPFWVEWMNQIWFCTKQKKRKSTSKDPKNYISKVDIRPILKKQN